MSLPAAGQFASLDEFWRDLADHVYRPARSSPAELTDRRRAFYAGAAAMMKLFENAAEHQDPARFEARMAVAYAELARFHQGLPE